MARSSRWGRWRVVIGTSCALAAALLWFGTTDHVAVWPARNTLQYHAITRWWAWTDPPAEGVARGTGTLRGTVRGAGARPIAGARVLLTRWDGTTYGAVSGAEGDYAIHGVPAGRLAGVAGAPGHGDAILGSGWQHYPTATWWWQGRRVVVAAGAETRIDTILPADPGPRRVAPGAGLRLGAPETVACRAPIDSQAVRRQMTFDSGGRPNQVTLLYTPLHLTPGPSPAAAPLTPNPAPSRGEGNGSPPPRATAPPLPLGSAQSTIANRGTRASGSSQMGDWGPGGEGVPTLLTVYPGPADGWECASVPLAAAGYAVVAAGPAYSFDLERDVDELVRLLDFARAGRLAGADGSRVAALGGSYSALHVLRLLQREAPAGRGVAAAVLLGAPADLFDMRRRFEQGTFIPPFGLDQALVALGFPDREPLRYWRYSGAYHVRRELPPTVLIHSRSDAVVPYQQSELLAGALAQAGVWHRLHLFEGASHYLLSEEGETLAIYQITLDFLAERLR